MIRVVLVAYLMIAAGARPALCCCAPLRIVDAVGARISTGVKPESGTKSVSCCCVKHEKTPASDPLPDGVPEQPRQPDDAPCPCQEGRLQLVAAHGPSETLRRPQDLCEWLHLSWLALPATPLLVASSAEVLREHPVMPFLTAQDMLRTFHLMRC